MNFMPRTTSLQAYHMYLFRKALHPEFFRIEAKRKINHGDYELEAWLFQGGHAIQFQHAGATMTEIVSESTDGLPDRGVIARVPCAGERDVEETIAERIQFVTSIQTETLSDHLYLGTYQEMLEHGQASDSLMTGWEDETGRPNLSVIDVQRYQEEVHVQGYHLRSDCCLVLRSQSIITAVLPKVKS